MTNKKTALLALATTLLALPVQAASIGASAGKAYYPSQDTCFKKDIYTTVRMDSSVSCGSGLYWNTDVPNNFTTSANHTFSAFGKSNNTSACPITPSACQSTCAAIVLGANGALVRWTGPQVLPTTAGWLSLGSLLVDQFQSIQFECKIQDSIGTVSAFSGF